MSDNPFRAAVQNQPTTTQVETSVPFFKDAIAADQLRHDAARMTRQQMFDCGVIGVEELDDEELRAGRCRDEHGRIPHTAGKTATIPRDLYEAMVAEHEARTDQKLREQLDTAIDVMVGVMVDDTVEPRDRMEAAKYLFERVKGKTPERIHVATGDKAPWEEVFSGVAKITRQRSKAIQEGVIDAEVVPMAGEGVAPSGGENVVSEGDGEVHMVHEAEVPVWARPAPAVPSHDKPAYSDPEKTNAQLIREAQEAAKDLAERRKAAKDRIQGAKKRRIIKRALGHDATLSSRMDSAMTSTVHKLMSPSDE